MWHRDRTIITDLCQQNMGRQTSYLISIVQYLENRKLVFGFSFLPLKTKLQREQKIKRWLLLLLEVQTPRHAPPALAAHTLDPRGGSHSCLSVWQSHAGTFHLARICVTILQLFPLGTEKKIKQTGLKTHGITKLYSKQSPTRIKSFFFVYRQDVLSV